jgi:Xaa-Pro aminopeptidase
VRRLDALARAPIWSDSIDYGHGTGHGVSCFLNVHEGPQAIAPGARTDSSTAMQLGMVTSNEPGIYRAGQWGVRIENLVANVPAPSSVFGEFLKFETLTMCPIDTRCIDLSLMRTDEISCFNEYHARVRSRLADGLSDEASHWLELRTAPISNSTEAHATVVSPFHRIPTHI